MQLHLFAIGAACDLDKHLVFEHASFNILHAWTASWQGLQRNATPSVGDVREGNRLASVAIDQLGTMASGIRASMASRTTNYQLQVLDYYGWWIGLRNAWSYSRIPFPLRVEELYDEWLSTLWLGATTAHAMLSRSHDWRISCMPDGFARNIVLAYRALSYGVIHFQHRSLALPHYLDPDVLDKTRDRLRAVGGWVADLLDGAEVEIRDMQASVKNQPSSAPETAFMPELFSAFDMSLDGMTGNWWDWPGMGDVRSEGATVGTMW